VPRYTEDEAATWLAGKQWGMDLMAAGRTYDNGLDYPAPEGWECLKERPAAASGDGRRSLKTS
jgi:hypothetical protein